MRAKLRHGELAGRHVVGGERPVGAGRGLLLIADFLEDAVNGGFIETVLELLDGFPPRLDAERDHRRMLEQQQRVADTAGAAILDERRLPFERLGVVDAAEPADGELTHDDR